MNILCTASVRRMAETTIREATEADVETLYELIVELAVYEKLEHEMSAGPEVLARSLFVERTAEAMIVEVGGEPAGYAIVCGTFSTFECKGGIWIEDIYVRPERRGDGVGRALFERVAGRAVERGLPRGVLSALPWNQLALGFYDRLGATRLDEWRMLRLDGEALRRLGGGE